MTQRKDQFYPYVDMFMLLCSYYVVMMSCSHQRHKTSSWGIFFVCVTFPLCRKCEPGFLLSLLGFEWLGQLWCIGQSQDIGMIYRNARLTLNGWNRSGSPPGSSANQEVIFYAKWYSQTESACFFKQGHHRRDLKSVIANAKNTSQMIFK